MIVLHTAGGLFFLCLSVIQCYILQLYVCGCQYLNISEGGVPGRSQFLPLTTGYLAAEDLLQHCNASYSSAGARLQKPGGGSGLKVLSPFKQIPNVL